MKKLLLLTALLLSTTAAFAQKTVYIPNEWKNPWPSDSLLYKESDPDCKYTWSKTRSVETDNFIIFWDKGWGNTAPDKLASSNYYYFDLNYMKQKLEEYYELEINKLGFVDPVSSNVAKYKIMVLLNHTQTWTCYGGGYDFQVPALWLNPATSKPVGSAVAHEVGHSFHYMCYAEDSNHGNTSGIYTGFHGAIGNGAAIWETTANWQACQSFPNEYFTMSGTGDFFAHTHNYAFTHEWHRYQAYMFLVWLCEKYGDIQTVANVWNTHETSNKDFNQVLMDYKGLSVEELYKLHFEFAMHAATYDMETLIPYRNNYIGRFDYRCVLTDKGYQVAYASCPQATGFNIIPLQVPAAGTEVTTHFTALRSAELLADGDPVQYHNGDTFTKLANQTRYNSNSDGAARAFRLGYVALLKDGTRLYFDDNTLHCTSSREKTEDVSFTVPENVDRMWLVVAPTPTRYFQHKWDEQPTNDDQWPYRFTIDGTDLASSAQVYTSATIDGREIADVSFTYDVYYPARTNGDHSGTSLSVNGNAAAMLGTAFQLQPDEIAGKMVTYSSAGPAVGKIMFYPASPRGSLVQRGSTANGYGHWFNASGNVSDYGNGYVFSEFDPATLTFTLGQYPGRCKNGNTYTIAQILRYRGAEKKYAKATFFFNIHITNGETSATLTSIDYTDPTGIEEVTSVAPSIDKTYDLQGRPVSAPTRGLYIINGKKVLIP